MEEDATDLRWAIYSNLYPLYAIDGLQLWDTGYPQTVALIHKSIGSMDKAVFMKNMRKKLLELVEGCAPPNRRGCAKLADRQGRPGPSATRPICRILSQLTYSSS